MNPLPSFYTALQRLFLFSSFAFAFGCQASPTDRMQAKADSLDRVRTEDRTTEQIKNMTTTEIATFGSGCFWCTEAVFQNIKGVVSAQSGYSGGTVVNPTYKAVCGGNTGHAEVIQVTYDPQKVSYAVLLEAFFASHDPTTLNRQGNDEGTQYRSAIFYHNEEQNKIATEVKAKLDKSGAWDHPIVTEIVPFKVFYKAEDYHQDYYNLNGEQPYCQYVIRPKLDKFKKAFAAYFK